MTKCLSSYLPLWNFCSIESSGPVNQRRRWAVRAGAKDAACTAEGMRWAFPAAANSGPLSGPDRAKSASCLTWPRDHWAIRKALRYRIVWRLPQSRFGRRTRQALVRRCLPAWHRGRALARIERMFQIFAAMKDLFFPTTRFERGPTPAACCWCSSWPCRCSCKPGYRGAAIQPPRSSFFFRNSSRSISPRA